MWTFLERLRKPAPEPPLPDPEPPPPPGNAGVRYYIAHDRDLDHQIRVRIDDATLKQIDYAVNEWGLGNRSELVRRAIHDYLRCHYLV